VAIELNNNGSYFPIWGTCLGFELLTFLDANSVEHRAHCASNNQALPLEFTEEYKNSKMFAEASDDLIEILKTQDVTSNFHQFCVTMKV
jgi:gamma-glutamyl hydrolase